MTSPNLGEGSLDDYADAANAIGLAAMQAMQAEDHIQAQIAAVAGPLGGIVEFITDGLGTIIADIQAYVTTGDTANLTAAAEFVQSKIAGLLGDVVRLLDAVWEAMSGEYEGDDEILQGIQALFAPLRKLIELITGVIGGLTAAPAAVVSWLSNLQEYLQGNAVGSDPAGFFTGLGNVAQSLMDALFSGYTGTVSSGATVSDLSSTMANVDNRITTLEGGGVLFTITSSTTLDLSAYSSFLVILIGSPTAAEAGTLASADSHVRASGGAAGGYISQEFTAAQLTALGLTLSAVPVTIATVAGSGESVFGSASVLKTIVGQNAIGTKSGFIQTESGAGNGGAGGYGNYGLDNPGVAGLKGDNTVLALGGSGGANSTTSNGSPGGNGEAASINGGSKGGGAGGGGGGGGGVQGFGVTVGYNGGAGGNGGFPGGAPGGGGGAGNGTTDGSGGAAGARSNGVGFVYAT